jgi:drug/metabolite transporter (DMT)-like permease
MTWQFFLVASILAASVNGLIHRTLMKDDQSDSKIQTVVFAGLTGIFGLVLAIFTTGFHLPPPSLWQNFLLMVALISSASVLTFQAYKTVEASEMGILLSTERLWTVILALMFLSETITLSKVLGTILVLFGVGVVYWKKHNVRFGVGIVIALVAALLYGISYVNGFYILRFFDAPSFVVLGSLLPALVIVLWQPRIVSKLRFYLIPRNGILVSLSALFDTLMSVFLYLAYQLGRNASQISPLAATSLVITVILAAIFLKERDNLLKKLLGSAIVVLGIIFLL